MAKDSLMQPSQIIQKLNAQINQPIQNVASSKDLICVDAGYYEEKGIVAGLTLKKCKLTQFPELITNLVNLKHLNISSNNLKVLPETLENLKDLEELIATNNQLKNLPDSIGQLTKLKHLKLRENRITKLPEG
ncbi:MAG: leucine-rich repeat domain-containing protein, partial [Candidatus Hodarchaeales archaeon]